MENPLVIIGAGGFGRETVDVVLAQNAAAVTPRFDLLGVVDSQPSKDNLDRLEAMGVTYLGDEKSWLMAGRKTGYLVGVGNPKYRREISARFDQAGNSAAVAVHPSANIGSLSSLGRGTVVCGGAQISTNVVIGGHVHVNPNVTVGHDTEVGEYVSLNPGSILSGNVVCEPGCLVGAGAVVLQGLVVGEGAIIGAASCVTRSVLPGSVIKGIPAR